MTNLKEAIEARDKFLQEHPKYLAYQREIDKLLDKTTNPQARMEALALLIAGKLKDLSSHLDLLNKKLEDKNNENTMS